MHLGLEAKNISFMETKTALPGWEMDLLSAMDTLDGGLPTVIKFGT